MAFGDFCSSLACMLEMLMIFATDSTTYRLP